MSEVSGGQPGAGGRPGGVENYKKHISTGCPPKKGDLGFTANLEALNGLKSKRGITSFLRLRRYQTQ